MARRSGWDAPWQPSGWKIPCVIPDVRRRDKITVPDPVLPLTVPDPVLPLIYKDADGNYHYTTPNKGKGTSSSVGTAPDGTTVVGDYHTHGDYSRPVFFGLFNVRTTADRDGYNSDHFSPTDMQENRDSAKTNPQFRGYLGTPSGALLIYNPITKQEGPLQ